jgi:hypothetical protein
MSTHRSYSQFLTGAAGVWKVVECGDLAFLYKASLY